MLTTVVQSVIHVSRLREGTTLLAHVIDMHISAGFSAVDLFVDSSSHFDLLHAKGWAHATLR